MKRGSMNPAVWAVGLMTGTVLDGNIDVALIKTDGVTIEEFGNYALYPYQKSTLVLLRESLDAALSWNFSGAEPAVFAAAEHRLSIEQASAVSRLVQEAGLTLADIGVVGFHGQTVLHQPPRLQQFGQTRQLGDGALMAETLGVAVVNDFRSADMRAGGQGAPLSAIYHQALLRKAGYAQESAVLNLGGVANISWWDGNERLIAFDTGPANAPINDFVRDRGAGDMDKDGLIAAAGVVDETLLETLLQHEYFAENYPKSLDRFAFSAQMASGLSLENGAALLSAFSASAVAKGLNLLPQLPVRLIVCGGGRHNPSLMQELRNRTDLEVLQSDSLGWRGDAIEAECFAYLAVRSLNGLPISFPETTGVAQPCCGGVLHGT